MCACVHSYVCVHACVYVHFAPSIEVGLAGLAPSNIERLPTPMISTVIVDKGLV